MSEKHKVEEILSELGRKIDHLIEETKQAGSKASEEMEVHIEKLKEQKERIEAEIRNSSSKPNEKWSEAKEYLNEAAESLHRAISVFFK